MTGDRADVSFRKMGELIHKLGREDAQNKASAPSTRMDYLGVAFDSTSFRKSIPPAKMAQLKKTLFLWISKTS